MKNVLHWKLFGIVIFKFVNNYEIDCDIVLKYLNFRTVNRMVIHILLWIKRNVYLFIQLCRIIL